MMSNIQMMLSVWAVTLLLHLTVCIAGDPCPPKAVLAPCTCSYLSLYNWTLRQSEGLVTPLPVTTLESRPKRDAELTPSGSSSISDTHYTVVDCQVSKSLTALEETVSTALNRKLVDKLIVANVPPRKEHTLARLPSGWLKNVRVRQFEVWNSKLSGDFIWYGNPFEGQSQTLLSFTAKKCFLTGSLTHDTIGTVNTKGLNSLPHIQAVDFSHNYLTSIMALSFRYPPKNLSSVILSHNSIQLVEGGTFQHILYLKQVDLSHNLLESVYRSFFAAPARYLQAIDLSWNSLTALPTDFFNNMPALQSVNLSNNFLYSVPEKPWAIIWKQLKNIDLTNNFVECNCDLMWLLPIISPSKVNVTTTPVPTPLPGQTVRGYCSKTIQPQLFASKHELVTLTRGHINC